jgi:hypothetical protein
MTVGLEKPQRHADERQNNHDDGDQDDDELLLNRSSSHHSSSHHHQNDSSTQEAHSIERASYPLRPNLSKMLQANAGDKKSSSSFSKKETAAQALTNILENSIEALDRWYFSVNAKTRRTLSHRTCLRISASGGESVTITDLGVGMTRADLINLLGVGSAPTKSNNSDANSSSSSSSNGCLTKELGGFYAAVCAVAVGVKVGTKVRVYIAYLLFQLVTHCSLFVEPRCYETVLACFLPLSPSPMIFHFIYFTHHVV